MVGNQKYIEVHGTKVSFALPRGFEQTKQSERMVAETFAAYLLGSLAAESRGKFGPYPEGVQSWQLDHSNDYWLRFEGDQVVLMSRYDAQGPVIRAMATLFLLRYGDKV